MAQGRVVGRKVTPAMEMFNNVVSKGITEVTYGHRYIEIECGCTSRKYGDALGKLKIYTTGQFLVTCLCNEEHKEGKMSPSEFEKHALQRTRNWKETIWVTFDKDKVTKRRNIDSEVRTKVPLRQAGLLKYYKHGANLPDRGVIRRRWKFHRDEFIKCSRCSKERRFRLRTKEDNKIYHDALLDKRWKCRDRPYDLITCEDDEERESRKGSRGCTRARACKGCTSCVCFGCLKCRFLNCNCRTCLDFMQNAAA